jgi:hypothetical protein
MAMVARMEAIASVITTSTSVNPDAAVFMSSFVAPCPSGAHPETDERFI